MKWQPATIREANSPDAQGSFPGFTRYQMLLSISCAKDVKR